MVLDNSTNGTFTYTNGKWERIGKGNRLALPVGGRLRLSQQLNKASSQGHSPLEYELQECEKPEIAVREAEAPHPDDRRQSAGNDPMSKSTGGKTKRARMNLNFDEAPQLPDSGGDRQDNSIIMEELIKLRASNEVRLSGSLKQMKFNATV